MPVQWGETGWKHDDHKTQREFERKNQRAQDLAKRIGSLESAMTARESAAEPTPEGLEPEGRKSVHGLVFVNQLPLHPGNNPDAQPYETAHWGYTPDNGYIGWMAHKIVRHNLQLPDKERFLINYTDMRIIDTTDLQSPDVWKNLHFAYSENHIPYIEPLDNNRLIFWHVIKPDLYQYMGGAWVKPDIYWVDEESRIARTDIVFYYVISEA